MPNTHAYYLRDLGQLLHAEAVRIRDEADGSDYDKGQLFAYYCVLSLIQQQAKGFQLSLKDLSLEGVDLEREFLTSS